MTDDPRAPAPRRAFHFNAGFLTQRRVRRILQLAGYDLKLGKPGPCIEKLLFGLVQADSPDSHHRRSG